MKTTKKFRHVHTTQYSCPLLHTHPSSSYTTIECWKDTLENGNEEQHYPSIDLWLSQINENESNNAKTKKGEKVEPRAKKPKSAQGAREEDILFRNNSKGHKMKGLQIGKELNCTPQSSVKMKWRKSQKNTQKNISRNIYTKSRWSRGESGERAEKRKLEKITHTKKRREDRHHIQCKWTRECERIE